MPHEVTLIPGDGIGPEVTEATRRVLEATGISFRWDVVQMGGYATHNREAAIPEAVLASIKRTRVALKGPVTTPVASGFRSLNVALRKRFDLYACLRPCKAYPGAPSLHNNVDTTIVRENIEDLYTGIEMEEGAPEIARLLELLPDSSRETIRADSAISIKAISASRSRRIAKYAFEYARSHGRKKVSAAHKANIMKFSDGLFLRTAREVAKEYPDIEFEDRLVDNMSMQLVRNPERFDVIVAPNLYGDLLSDLCAGLIGGLGLAPGANVGDDAAIFEPAHGSAPRYAGENRANPMAMMLSGVMLLRHLGEPEAAGRLEKAIADIIAEGRIVTYDLKPGDPASAAGTAQVADAVETRLRRLQ
jgi:isocitrate dehydrogenase (NAD+)